MAPQTRRQKKALAAAAPVIHPADRLSKHPEEIQAHILSFLPAQEAVHTCVLARTWRDLWKLTRCLIITGRKHVLVQEVRGFVDSLLCLRLDGLDGDDYAPIDACEIVFNWGYGGDHDDDDIEITRAVGRWIPRILECQVQSLRVDSWHGCTCCGPAITMLDIPLVSLHLTRLELCGLWFWEDCGRVCLDLSGCPALEHLEIRYCNLINLIKLTSQSVKHLVIKHCESYDLGRLHICFPHLVSLWLEDFYDKTLVLGSMPQLAVAHVSIENNPEEDDSDDDEQDITKCMVLEGLAEAKHLVLLSDDNTITFTRDLRLCPTYSKLKTLVVNQYWCESADCSALACMLQHAPVLEKLTVLFSRKVKPKYDMIVEGRPDATGNSTMISQHLKIVELKCFDVDQRVVKVQKFLGTLNIWFQDRVTEGSK